MSSMRRTNRRGMAVVFALVCLAMAAVLAGVATRAAVLGWQSARDEGRRAQAAWLADSAIARAGAQLAADPDYRGETWRIPAKLLDGRRDAVVLIEVTASNDKPRERLVRIRADYPDDPIDRIRKSKQLTFTLPETEPRP